jgi:hypothetical protein
MKLDNDNRQRYAKTDNHNMNQRTQNESALAVSSGFIRRSFATGRVSTALKRRPTLNSRPDHRGTHGHPKF